MRTTADTIDRDREYARNIRVAAALTLAALTAAFVLLPQPQVRPYSTGARSLVVEQLLVLDGPLAPPPSRVPLRAKLPIPAADGQAQDSGVGLNTFSETGYVNVQDRGLMPLPYYKVERKPEVLQQVVPAYPELARAAGIQGRAVVQVVVDTTGMVGAAELLQGSGSSLLDAAALAAARGFRFRPGYQLDRPVPVAMAIPFSFRLD